MAKGAAAKEGGSFSTAASHRDTLAEHMTSAQIDEGQRLTREWKPKPETRKLGMWDIQSLGGGRETSPNNASQHSEA
jgi:hypothetical protein